MPKNSQCVGSQEKEKKLGYDTKNSYRRWIKKYIQILQEKKYTQNVNQNNNKTMTRKIMIKLQKLSITNCSKHGNRIIKSKIVP